jgi:hypothetical protein
MQIMKIRNTKRLAFGWREVIIFALSFVVHFYIGRIFGLKCVAALMLIYCLALLRCYILWKNSN